jgi:KUP system potassium uptake protein
LPQGEVFVDIIKCLKNLLASPKGNNSNEVARLPLLSLLALGVVYGDIGTSPLYAVRYCFIGQGKVEANYENILGILSLIT